MEAARTQSSSIKDHADSQKRSHLKRSNNKWQQLDECYKFPIGCEIPVDDYIPKEYTPESSKCTYKEYDYKPNTYINGREAEYFGSVDYTLTPKNYLPFWSKEDNVKTVDEMETEVIKEEDEVEEEEEEQHDEEEKADETVNDEPEREDSATPSDVTAAVLVTKDEPEEGPNTHEKQETPPHSPSPSPSPSPVAQKSPSPKITDEMQQPKEVTPPPPESPVQEVPEERGHVVSPIPAAVVIAVPVVETSNKPQNVITTKLAPEIIATIEAYNKIHSLP